MTFRTEPYSIKLVGIARAASDGRAIASIAFPGQALGRVGTISRLIASIGSIEGIFLLNDTFARTLAADQDAGLGWGTPAVGPAWQSDVAFEGLNWLYSVNGSQGLIAYQQGIGSDLFGFTPVATTDVDFLVTMVSLSAVGAPAASEFRLAVRVQDSDNYYFLELHFSAANTLADLRLWKDVAGVFTSISGLVAKVVALPAFARVTMKGAVLSGTVWNTGAAEPAPDVQAADLSIVAGGGVGVGGKMDAAASGTWTLDNAQASGVGTVPTWDAYLGGVDQPINLRDSSAPAALSRWVPALVNGQPFFPGDVLNIVAYGLAAGTQITVTTNVILQPAS